MLPCCVPSSDIINNISVVVFVSKSTVKIVSSYTLLSFLLNSNNQFLPWHWQCIEFHWHPDLCCSSHGSHSYPYFIRGAIFVMDILIIKLNLIMWLLFKPLCSYFVVNCELEAGIVFLSDNQTLVYLLLLHWDWWQLLFIAFLFIFFIFCCIIKLNSFTLHKV